MNTAPIPRTAVLLPVLLALLLPFGCSPPAATTPTRVKVATMRLGTAWYVFGATLYRLLRRELPPGTRVEVMAKGGGIGNATLVDSGKATLGLSNVCTAVWARDGHAVYGGKAHENIRALVGGLNPVWITALAREEFIQRTGNDTLEKILTGDAPVRVVMKPRGSSVPVVADMILEALGTDRAAIRARGGAIIQVSAKQVPSILRDGRADLYFEVAPLGHPTVTEVSLTANVRFLDMPERVLESLSASGLLRAEIPEHFKGQRGPTKAINLGTMLIVHKDLPEELAYLITKTICENRETMAMAHKAWARFAPERAGDRDECGIPLHAGARRYYDERGWLKEAESHDAGRR